MDLIKCLLDCIECFIKRKYKFSHTKEMNISTFSKKEI